MAAQTYAKPPKPLSLEDISRRGENWKQFKRDWTFYEIAAKINTEEGEVQVAHLLNIIGKEGQDMFETFTLSEADRKDIKKVLEEFQTRCAPMTNVIYERYLFNKRVQEAGESLDHYITVVMKQADLCTYGNLRD